MYERYLRGDDDDDGWIERRGGRGLEASGVEGFPAIVSADVLVAAKTMAKIRSAWELIFCVCDITRPVVSCWRCGVCTGCHAGVKLEKTKEN